MEPNEVQTWEGSTRTTIEGILERNSNGNLSPLTTHEINTLTQIYNLLLPIPAPESAQPAEPVPEPEKKKKGDTKKEVKTTPVDEKYQSLGKDDLNS